LAIFTEGRFRRHQIHSPAAAADETPVMADAMVPERSQQARPHGGEAPPRGQKRSGGQNENLIAIFYPSTWKKRKTIAR